MFLSSALLLPFIGIMLMEGGEYGTSVGMEGYRNHASEAFAGFVLLVWLTFMFFGATLFRSPKAVQVEPVPDPVRFRKILRIGTAVLGAAALIMVFFFGGIHVIAGAMDRGEFRANLGLFGSLAYFIIKFLAPGIVAGILFFGRGVQKRTSDRIAMALAVVFAVLTALSFGFKSGLVTLFLPTLIAMQPRLTLKRVLTGAALFFGTVFAGYYAFETLEQTDISFVFSLLFTRLTVLTGDVSWRMWDLLMSGEQFPNYAATLPAMLGDRMLTAISGIGPEQAYDWVMLHSSLIPTLLSGYSPEEIVEGGHNNTATSFSEGILFGGIPGIIVFAILTGLVLRMTISWLEKAIAKRNFASACVAACFAVHCTWAWIISGGINMILHISIAFNLGLLYLILSLMFHVPRRR